LLGALAETGDRAALEGLIRLLGDNDKTIRPQTIGELRRLRQMMRDPQIQERLAAAITDPGDISETLSPAPYAAAVIEQRKKQLAAALKNGDKLACYLDCGVESEVRDDSGVGLRQRNGRAWQFPDSAQVAAPTFGTVAFNGGRLEFEAMGLAPDKRYAVGFSWWDFDSGGRVQSAQLEGGESRQKQVMAANESLPAYTKAKQMPKEWRFVVDPKLAANGKINFSVSHSAGPNVVLSELWICETAEEYKPAAAVASAANRFLNPAWRPNVTRILLVTGQEYPGHPWKQTAPALAEELEKDARLQIQISEDPHALATMDLGRYQAILLHFMNWEQPSPGEKARENLKKYAANGGGLGLVHFACGAWQDWPEFRSLAGRAWDPKLRGHDPRGKYTVEMTEVNHPITAGLKNFETDDELYTCLAGDRPIEIVAKARSKVDAKDYPMAFVFNYEKGRVFHCVLGHDLKAITVPGTTELYRRGMAWAAGLKPTP
jgi:type 1 glutamine amidotransferase